MKNQISMILIVILFISMNSSPDIGTLSVTAQGSELFLPDRVQLQSTLQSQFGNDIFFETNGDIAALNHEFQSETSTFSLYTTDGQFRDSLGGYSILDPFSASDTNLLYHVSNGSAEDLSLQLTAEYFDLTGGDTGAEGLSNLLLFEDEMSGFRFDASIGTPLVLNFEIEGDASVLVIDVLLVSPSGQVWDYSAQHDNKFSTYTNHFIPIVPTETGLYTLYLIPEDEDVILQNLSVMDSPPIQNVAGGYTARLQGVSTQTTFFKLGGNTTTSSPVLFDISVQAFREESIGDPDLQRDLLGDLEINYFAGGASPLGAQIPDQALQTEDNDVYVAVTVTPPNDANQFIKSQKEELGFDGGFDLEYAFWAESFEIPDFVVNENINVLPTDIAGNNYYYYTPASEQIIGLNSTSGAVVTFYDLVNTEDFYQLDSTTHNLLETQDDIMTFLPAGEYLVYLSDGVPGSSNEARITTFSTVNLNPGDNAVQFSLNDPVFYRLPVNIPTREYFNITYLDQVNMSIALEFALYDSQGNVRDTGSKLFQDNPITVDNNTIIGSTSTTTHYNVRQGYMRVDMTTNTLYNSDTTINDSNLDDIQANFRITRLNYLDIWETLADREVVSKVYEDESNVFLNATAPKDTLLRVYDFTTSDSSMGYHFTFTSTNVSYQLLAIVDWTDTPGADPEWYDESPSAETIDGVDHYIQTLEFGTNAATSFAFVLIFDANAAIENGTLSTSLTEITPQSVPAITMGSIGTVEYDVPDQVTDEPDDTDTDTNATEEDSTLNDILTNPLTYVGIVGVAAIIGALVYYLRSRGKFPA